MKRLLQDMQPFVTLLKLFIIILFLLINPVGSFAENEDRPKYLVITGISLPEYSSTLDNYWKDGLTIGIGGRYPFWIFYEGIVFGASLEYSYFENENPAVVPIDVLDKQTKGFIKTNDTHIFTAMVDIYAFFKRIQSKVRPYICVGGGYIRRSDNVFISYSPHFPSGRTSYKGKNAWSFGTGLDIRLKDNLWGVISVKGIIADTFPSTTGYWPLTVGLAYSPK